MTTQTTDPHCQIPSPWRLFLFFATNYLAHCATIRAYPAENRSSSLLAAALALFMPASGVVRAMNALIRHSRFYSGESIQQAVRAGAVCMLVRTKGWKPRDNEIITGLKLGSIALSTTDTPGESIELLANASAASTLRPALYHATIGEAHVEEFLPVPFFSSSIDFRLANVHGAFRVPPGYEFAYIPCDVKARNADQLGTPAELEARSGSPRFTIQEADATAASASISSDYGVSKSLIAIGQVVFSAVTLYETRYSQLDRYGYAAYGLTVIPFLIMSIVNLASQIVMDDYPALYMIHSLIMDEARQRGGVFDGVVGTLEIDEEEATEVYVWRATAQENRFILERASTGVPFDIQPALTAGQSQAILVQFGEPGPAEPHQALTIQNCPRLKRLGKPMKLISRESATSIVIFVLPAVIISLSLLIIGVLTHFQPGHSTVAQRAWTMSWLAMGIVGGAMPDSITLACTPLQLYSYYRVRNPGMPWWGPLGSSNYRSLVVKVIIGVISVWGIFFAPMIGGFVVVGQMINEFGLCN